MLGESEVIRGTFWASCSVLVQDYRVPDPDVAGWQGGCNVVGRGLSFTSIQKKPLPRGFLDWEIRIDELEKALNAIEPWHAKIREGVGPDCFVRCPVHKPVQFLAIIELDRTIE